MARLKKERKRKRVHVWLGYGGLDQLSCLGDHRLTRAHRGRSC